MRPTPATYVAFGVYEVNQDLYSNADRSGSQFGVPRDSGVYLPVQFGYEPKLGPPIACPAITSSALATTPHVSKAFPVCCLPPVAPAASQSGNIQLWVLTDQMLLRNGPGDQDGVIALAGYVHNDPDRSHYAVPIFRRPVGPGFWSVRPKDTDRT